MALYINKIRYGIRRFCDELIGREDYWHLRLRPLPVNLIQKEYFHDMYKKGFYDGELKNNIPIYYLNGIYPVYFHITTLNYGLGLLSRLNRGEKTRSEILMIVNWLLLNQLADGSWRYNFPLESNHELADNKPSGMTQGLALSFLIRVASLNIVTVDQPFNDAIKKAFLFLNSPQLCSIYNGIPMIEEFYNPGDGILNGYIFAIYGIYDYCCYINDMTYFNQQILDLKQLLSFFSLGGYWTKYSISGIISSKFYHQLHIDMMTSLYNLTNDKIFLSYKKRWQIGLKLSPLYIVCKSFQKVMHVNDMVMSFSKSK